MISNRSNARSTSADSFHIVVIYFDSIMSPYAPKSMTFVRDRYFHQREPPSGIRQDFRLTLDEFFLFDPNLRAQKINSKEIACKDVKIETACKAMRKKNLSQSEAACFSLCLSANDKLNSMIELPRLIKEKSLFEKYWPSKDLSNFFKYKNKLFHAYQAHYESRPYIAYGGLTEWLYVFTGKMSIILIKPTQLNLCKYSTLSHHDDLIPEHHTAQELHLVGGDFFIIPAGWISIRRANQTTFVLGGEILHHDDLVGQFEVFDNDVIRLTNSCDLIIQQNDAEIRYIYWFYAVHLLNHPLALKQTSDECLECLKSHLENWRLKFNKLHSTKELYISPSAFAPTGIRIDLVIRDLQRFHSSKRRSLKGSKDPVDVSKEHLAIDY
jgi:hypothetical protein